MLIRLRVLIRDRVVIALIQEILCHILVLLVVWIDLLQDKDREWKFQLSTIRCLNNLLRTDYLKIQGSSNFCSQNTAQIYPIQKALINSTFNWTWTNSCPNHLPNGSQCSITKDICNGTTLLTYTVTSPSGIFTIFKTISFINPPNEYSFVPYITNVTNTTYMSHYCNKLTNICTNTRKPDSNKFPPISDVISPNNYCAGGYITDVSATLITLSGEKNEPWNFSWIL